MSPPVEIERIEQIESKLPDPRGFSVSDVRFIEKLFDDSNVKLHSIVNLVVVFRRLIDNWSKNKIAEGKFIDLWTEARPKTGRVTKRRPTSRASSRGTNVAGRA